MALIAPDIVRYTVVSRCGGEDIMNIVDVRLTSEIPPVGDRDDAIHDLAGDILNNWTDHILSVQHAALTAYEVRWVDLNSADGSTGSRSSTDAETWPKAGTASGGRCMPNNVVMWAAKNLEGGGRQSRRGRMGLGGMLEEYTSSTSEPNTWTADAVAGINAALEDWKDGIQDIDAGWGRRLVVIHTVAGLYTGYSPISSYSVRPTIGTLRRRMPGYGS